MSFISGLRERLFGGEPPLDPAAVALVEQLVAEIRASDATVTVPPDTFPAARPLLDGGPAERVERVRAILHRRRRTDPMQAQICDAKEWTVRAVLDALVNRLLRPRQPYTQAQLAELLRLGVTTMSWWGSWQFPLGSVLSQIPDALAGAPMDVELRERLERFRDAIAGHRETAESRRAIARIDAALRTGEEPAPLVAHGPAGIAILSEIGALPQPSRSAWIDLVRHGLEVTSASPPAAWASRARALVEAVGVEDFTRLAARWLALGPAPGAARDARATDADADLLKGLVWLASTVESPALAVAVGDLAIACFRKIPNVGAVCVRAGNACLGALGRMPALDGVAQLSRARTAVKYTAARKLIDKALAGAASRTGWSATDLEELAVPALGFGADGVRRETVGSATAELAITGSVDVELAWITAGGRRQASMPADAKAEHPQAAAELRKAVKDAERMLQAQRDRIEAFLLDPREWDEADWRARYLDHPLLAAIGRRLIWSLRSGERTVQGIWSNGRLVDAGDQPIAPDAGARVSLWHPLDGDVGTVTAWRRWLEAHEVTQPFKQAHREVYILTHAERETATYSNRFAAHVLRQHQFAALCQQRAWRYTLQGQWDSHNTPFRDLPGGALRAEFWVEPPGDGLASPTGIFLQLLSDQVRFVAPDGAPQPLAGVAPRVFSEVMRDVDLFVGVSSIAADPTWQDHGDRQAFGAYWEQAAFGELSVSAQTRREVLAPLLPKLRIAARCMLEERFLVVRGDLKTYRIHLGSGNIVMEPGSQYLCIVPGRSTRGPAPHKIFLPFEGDATLSIILSKAFLLAADTKITDPAILTQLRR